MLEKVLMYLNNWFLVPDGVHTDTYTMEDGGIVLPFLAEGQYFRVLGSLYNDGLHQYPATDLKDETFQGAVWALAIPPQVEALADEISAWQEKQGQPGAYASESFGGYSYSKATNASGMPVGWQDVFRAQLKPYRKLRENSFVRSQRPVRSDRRPWKPGGPFGR